MFEGMVDPAHLDGKARIAIAQVEGAAQRLTRPVPLAQDAGKDPIAEIHAITTDPFLLGIACGTLMVNAHRAAAAELVRRAGADRAVARAQHAWVVARLRRYGGAWPDIVEPETP